MKEKKKKTETTWDKRCHSEQRGLIVSLRVRRR